MTKKNCFIHQNAGTRIWLIQIQVFS